jgi:hypothetical protein
MIYTSRTQFSFQNGRYLSDCSLHNILGKKTLQVDWTVIAAAHSVSPLDLTVFYLGLIKITHHNTPQLWQQHCHHQFRGRLQQLLCLYVTSDATNRTHHTLCASHDSQQQQGSHLYANQH